MFSVWVEERNGLMTKGELEAEIMLCIYLITVDYFVAF